MATSILPFKAVPPRPRVVPTPSPSLDRAHAACLASAIAVYRQRAEHALTLAQEARQRGELLRWRGLMDEALTYQAMADGLADQANTREAQS